MIRTILPPLAFAAILLGAALPALAAEATSVRAADVPVTTIRLDATPADASVPAMADASDGADGDTPALANADDPGLRRVFDDRSAGGSPLSKTASPAGEIARLAGSLLVVLSVIAGGVWVFRRYAPRTAGMFSTDNLRVLSRTYLGPKQVLYMVRAPSSLLILGATQERICLLSEITDPVEIERVLGSMAPSAPRSATKTFQSLLAGTGGAREGDEIEQDLASAVKGVSDRFAELNRRLGDLEKSTD